MKKTTIATVAVWLVAGAAAVFLGHTMTQEPTAHAAMAPSAPEAPKPAATPEKAPEVLPEITIVEAKPRAAKAAPVAAKAAPCRDGETREVGAVWNAKPGSGQGATGVRTVTLRCH